jgi:magnesium transporter
MNFELSREFIDNLRMLIEANDEKQVAELLQELHAADIAEILEGLTMEEARYIYVMLDGEKASDVLIEIPEDDRRRFLNALPPEYIARQFIEFMDSDDAADILGELDEDVKKSVLNEIGDVDIAGDIVDLLEYEEDTAGGIMAKELVAVNENWTVATCLKEIGRQSEDVDDIYYVYVVDDDDKLKGVLSLKKLILNSTSTQLKHIYNPDVKWVTTDTPQEEVAQMMEKYDLVAIPVVDEIGRLKGRITFDDVMDVMREEAERDYNMVSGITGEVEVGDKVWTLTRARIPWLMVGLFGGIMGAQVLGAHEDSLSRLPATAFFIPLIAAMAGNVGVQSSSIVVQTLASGVRDFATPWQKIVKQLSIAFITGGIFSILIFIYNYLFSDNMSLTYAVSLSLFIVMTIASVFGSLIPLALNRMKIDPAVATGPFITTMNDVLGLTIYLLVSKFFLTVM